MKTKTKFDSFAAAIYSARDMERFIIVPGEEAFTVSQKIYSAQQTSRFSLVHLSVYPSRSQKLL